MSKPQLLTKEQQSELVGKLLEMLGLPPLVKHLKIEWSVGQLIEIECQSFLDSQIPALTKEKVYCVRSKVTGDLYKTNGVPALLLEAQFDKWSNDDWELEIFTGQES